ncbi:hypothetical protein [Vibrio sp. H11]|uniref:hypothetical protein n=1 Tax=Vibrio sp. H11 TaxID=2565928 RepID=UPI001F0D6252|nr:hypothetical protein [Vibrio sp. H11]
MDDIHKKFNKFIDKMLDENFPKTFILISFTCILSLMIGSFSNASSGWSTLGVNLARFTSTALIALLAAKMALNNMSKNEKRKRNKEEYHAFNALQSSLSQILYSIRNIQEIFDNYSVNKANHFYRSALIPQISLSEFNHDKIALNQFYYLTRAANKLTDNEKNLAPYLDNRNINYIFSRFDRLKFLFEIHHDFNKNNSFNDYISRHYLGNNRFEIKFSDLKETIPFNELCKFLSNGEAILIELTQIDDIICNTLKVLRENVREIIAEDAIDDDMGIPFIVNPPPRVFEVNKLSEEEEKKLRASDYPI